MRIGIFICYCGSNIAGTVDVEKVAKEALKLLEAVTEGLGEGKIVFSDEADRIVMKPKGLLNMRVTASQDELQDRISIRLTWRAGGEKGSRKKALSVSSK